MMQEMLEMMMIEICHATRARKQCDEEEDDDGKDHAAKSECLSNLA